MVCSLSSNLLKVTAFLDCVVAMVCDTLQISTHLLSERWLHFTVYSVFLEEKCSVDKLLTLMSVEGSAAGVVIISPLWEEVLQSRLGSAASVFWISGIYFAHLPRFLGALPCCGSKCRNKKKCSFGAKGCQNFQALWVTSPSPRSRARFGSADIPMCPSPGWVTSPTCAGGLALLPSLWFLCVSSAQSMQRENPLPAL